VHFAYQNVTKEMISQTLTSLNLGIIREISFKPAINKKNENGNSIVVHFDEWFRNSTSDKVRQKLISGESIKINYTPKSYLQVIAFQSKAKTVETPRTFKQPTITFDDDFGPKLGPNCSEKYNTPKVKIEKPKARPEPRPNPRPTQERKRNTSPPPPTNRRHTSPPPTNRRHPSPIPQRHRPTTPECPPPTPTPTETKKQTVYHYHNTTPDAFDLNKDIASRGVLLPPPRPKKQTKKFTFQDSPSDTEEEDEIQYEVDKVSQDLYGDLTN